MPKDWQRPACPRGGKRRAEPRRSARAPDGRRRTRSRILRATVVEWSVDYTPPFGVIGKLGAFLFMARVYQNELEGSLDNLKTALEV